MSSTSAAQQWQSPGPTSTPPMLSPTSAPKPSSAVPERTPKLRASCDACAASKVKCSKEHPICARCTANGSQCIYGMSRKHGKPGRTRKRNPDGTPFVKGQSKQRPSPDGSEFGKFRVQAQPLLPDLPELDAQSWPSTPEWSDFDYNTMTPDTAFSDCDFNWTVDDLLMESPQLDSTTGFFQDSNTVNKEGSFAADSTPAEWANAGTVRPELTFRDPFAKKDLELELPLPPDFQALKDFCSDDSMQGLDFSLGVQQEPFNSHNISPVSSQPQSPKGTGQYFNSLRTNIAIPTSQCCYGLAYATVESLHFRTPETGDGTEHRSLDSVLSVCKDAVRNVLKMLSCRCSSDPHLAMLYSSITSKILSWYQIAAGVKPASPPASSFTASSPSVSASSSTFSSPLSSPSDSCTSFNLRLQPLKIGQFEFDAADQESLTRQVVLRELKKCGALVEALAQWCGDESAEQAEFLYDVLGAWLKSELYKTLREVTRRQEEEQHLRGDSMCHDSI
ncbi:hypothetical protein EJ04DRAFT_542048 [Polyplosphaeria fusca]|uniref:Zn(2)-C6 fungal-type domain-containing protein n=1 Tax=Polyplosphaeria fusca TaxID=682080 RepID=A0A9P4R0V2_9PLEO|nr:hypothetical protein EJ04DRAFT_542048 [Polyplosphaeria fusca]